MINFMNIEYEATFPDINKSEIRGKLKSVGAELSKKEFLQKRHNFYPPKSSGIRNLGWMRVRDENGKITMTLKIRGDESIIEGQRELEVEVDSYNRVKEMLEILSCEEKNYQETKREIWKLDDVEIMIDEWPFLEPFVEIEGKNEKKVKEISEKLGFDYTEAIFGPVNIQYDKKYNLPEEFVDIKVKKLVFKGKNPFIKKFKM